jgi:hypothetical protein
VDDAQELVRIEIVGQVTPRRLDELRRQRVVLVGKLLPHGGRRVPRPGHPAGMNPNERRFLLRLQPLDRSEKQPR